MSVIRRSFFKYYGLLGFKGKKPVIINPITPGQLLVTFVLVAVIYQSAAETSGCLRDFNADGSPTPCLKQYRKMKRECPRAGESCFDPALAGVWILRSQRGMHFSASERPPRVQGWVIHTNGDVFPLAINFDTGTLTEGKQDLTFIKVSYGCKGELYQDTYFVGRIASYCGRYRFKGKNLGISKTKSDDFTQYAPVKLGKKVAEPIHFVFNMTLDRKPIPIPRIAPSLPAYALLLQSKTKRMLRIYVNNNDHRIYFSIPDLSGTGRHTGPAAGKVYIERDISDHVAIGFRSSYQDPKNEIKIVKFDRNLGWIKGSFNYTVARSGSEKTLNFSGKFDIKLYERRATR